MQKNFNENMDFKKEEEKTMKGSVQDIIIFAIVLFVMTFSIIISYLILDELHGGTENLLNSRSRTMLAEGRSTITIFNAGFLVLTIGFGIAVIVSSFYIRTHPVFFFFAFLMLVIFIMVGAIFTNIFWEFINATPFANVVDAFPIMIEVMKNYPLVICVIGFLAILVMYAKSRSTVEEEGI